MSSLRVINISPEESGQLTNDNSRQCDEPPDSPIPTSGGDDTHLQLSGGPFELLSTFSSPVPGSVFDMPEEPHDDRCTEPTSVLGSQEITEELDSYNLKPPPPALTAQTSLESVATRFFSVDHLDEILRDYGLAFSLNHFLTVHRPAYNETLRQYVEAKKAMAAVEYANAIAAQIQPPFGHPTFVAAILDDEFEARTRRIVEELIEEALPVYLTHRLVSLCTDTLVKEITGSLSPVMHELVPSLAEVYCITDPSTADNDIVYASQEFYHTSQYAKEHVIGRNCRFLQGPRTSTAAIRRLTEAVTKGEEICETLLNYRRDGSPFMNLLMIAPLYDNKGVVRYFLGCQIDVTSLIEDGRGLKSFAQLLSRDRSHDGFGHATQDPSQALSDLGQLLTEDEASIVRNRAGHSPGVTHAIDSAWPYSVHKPYHSHGHSVRSSRIILGMDETVHIPSPWASASPGPSGRLPGVYQNYMLVRPYPSLRITFTSPALRIPGLLQSKLLDRIAGTSSVRDGLLDALSRGTGVTAKITWLTSAYEAGSGKPRWIHCTPLFGSDDRVGVWMVVMVENEQVTGSLNAYCNRDRTSLMGVARPPGAERHTTTKLYSDYLRREGRPGTSETQQTTSSTRVRREADEHFRDF